MDRVHLHGFIRHTVKKCRWLVTTSVHAIVAIAQHVIQPLPVVHSRHIIIRVLDVLAIFKVAPVPAGGAPQVHLVALCILVKVLVVVLFIDRHEALIIQVCRARRGWEFLLVNHVLDQFLANTNLEGAVRLLVHCNDLTNVANPPVHCPRVKGDVSNGSIRVLVLKVLSKENVVIGLHIHTGLLGGDGVIHLHCDFVRLLLREWRAGLLGSSRFLARRA